MKTPPHYGHQLQIKEVKIRHTLVQGHLISHSIVTSELGWSFCLEFKLNIPIYCALGSPLESVELFGPSSSYLCQVFFQSNEMRN